MPRFRPALEQRQTPSIAYRTGNVLTIFGTPEADNITVLLKGAKLQVADGASFLGQVTAASIKRIVIDVGGGADRVTIANVIAKPAFIYGGKDNDVLIGGGGNDQIYGGDGFDVLKGRGGNDTLWGGALTDTLLGGAGANEVQQDSPNRTYAMNAIELDVVNRVNQERLNAGLLPLSINSTLAFAAQQHASQMATRSNILANPTQALQDDLLGSNTPTLTSRLDYAGYDAWSTFGENLAFGYTTSVDVMAAWLTSSWHRANILNPNVTEIGVGVVANAEGKLFWCQVFGDL